MKNTNKSVLLTPERKEIIRSGLSSPRSCSSLTQPKQKTPRKGISFSFTKEIDDELKLVYEKLKFCKKAKKSASQSHSLTAKSSPNNKIRKNIRMSLNLIEENKTETYHWIKNSIFREKEIENPGIEKEESFIDFKTLENRPIEYSAVGSTQDITDKEIDVKFQNIKKEKIIKIGNWGQQRLGDKLARRPKSNFSCNKKSNFLSYENSQRNSLCGRSESGSIIFSTD
ncbi:unnamed protein product [Blepharisma stoltei]|uniref:Uncharacterized protein n=1 Tax=Blepharisma stoltei TaxID=1481888 RepID=A0AAU9IXB6_9CILI|nr:unnamed protein product [Blepharisma stoltei]